MSSRHHSSPSNRQQQNHHFSSTTLLDSLTDQLDYHLHVSTTTGPGNAQTDALTTTNALNEFNNTGGLEPGKRWPNSNAKNGRHSPSTTTKR